MGTSQPPMHPTINGQSPQISTAHLGGAVTADSVLHDAISLPSNERVLFFNDLRLHLHREGLLSVRNRSKKQPTMMQPPSVVPGISPAPGSIQKQSLRH